MKKWMYLIFPGAMLGLFLVFFLSHQKESDARDKARAEIVAQKEAADKAKKQEAERKAQEDAKKRQAEREAEEAAKLAAKVAKQAAADKEVSDDTKKAIDAGAASQKQLTKLEADLDALRKSKDKATREAFDLAKQVELAKVAKRNAEFEIQRTTEMVSRRASDSSLTRMPPPPPLPPVAK
jgi:hypothetical protein